MDKWAHGVVVSHPLRMRKALGSNPSVSRTNDSELCLSLCGWRSGLARVCQQQFHICRRQTYMWVHSSVARAADRRSAGPWFKSGCALGTERPALDERIVVKPTRHGENIVWRAPATRSSLAILNLRHCFPPALGLAYATACKLCTYTLQDIRWTLHVDLTGETL